MANELGDPIINESEEDFKIQIDVSSEKDYNNQVNVEGSQGVIVNILIQLFEAVENDGLVEVFDVAIEEYYRKYPERRLEF